ncbi:MAG: deoxycytidine triphosphate deaminase [Gammaproteobacteria bacterium]|nr:deoxycytidine triphosphate deaminase [Gammaproteobacteria bacterium]
MSQKYAAFWSGESLHERLGELIEPFNPDRIDCAAYTLSVGEEVYVSPNEKSIDPLTATIRRLGAQEGFAIPPGQFAFLLTEEIIEVPNDALAFISMRARIKFRGLVNVSGFHVDPGFRGQLTYAVFNAGPAPVHLKRGQPIFLIWYAGLDSVSSFRKNGDAQLGIDPQLITGIAGEIHSFAGLSQKIDDCATALSDRVHAIEKEQVRYRVVAVILLGIVVALAVGWLDRIVAPSAALSQSAVEDLRPLLPQERSLENGVPK